MKFTSTKGLTPLITIIIIALVIGTGIIVYQSSKTRNEAITALTSTTLGTETTSTTVLSPTATSTIDTFCLDWEFFKDPKNYDDGQVHEEIKIIQEKLGVTPVDGHYGPLTKTAIDKFNEEQKIMVYNEYSGASFSPGIIGWTVSKFNDLYCSLPKPKVTITLINYPPSKTNKMPEWNDIYTYIIPNFLDFTHKIKIEPSGTNVTLKTIEVPYSGSIGILPALSPTSSVYDNNTLLFKLENNEITYDLIADTNNKSPGSSNILYSYTGQGDFIWNGIKKDCNIKFEFGK